MHFTFLEVYGTLVALVLFATLLVCGGAFFACLLNFPGFAEARLAERAGLSLLCGLACLPIVLDLTGRLGPVPMALVATASALVGAALLPIGAAPARLDGRWLAAGGVWIAFATLCLIDIPDGSGGLLHSHFVVDYVKHAATTWSIAQSGTPPFDPLFHEPGRTAAYYYFFYTLTAVVSIVGAPLRIAARHAAFASGIVTGFAILALLYQVWRRSGCDEAAGVRDARPAMPWIVALMLAAGLDIIPGLALAMLGNRPLIEAPIDGWTAQITPWVAGSLWVPHHVAALCAAFAGFLALARPAGGGDIRRTVFAGLAFASCAGLSIYMAIGAAMIAAVFLARLIAAARYRDAADLTISGLIAGALAASWLLTLVGYGGEAQPLALGIRGSKWFAVISEDPRVLTAARAITFGPFYLVQFGIFALGSYVFWRRAGRRGMAGDGGWLLVVAAPVSLVLGAFVRSTTYNNDLGWRIVMFAEASMFVWTLSAIRAGWLGQPRLAPLPGILLALGYCTVAFGAVQSRVFYLADTPTARQDRASLPDEIRGWTWLDGALPTGSIVQERPADLRSFSYGLYGRFRTAVSDRANGMLFGAPKTAVRARVDDIRPIYDDPQATLGQVLDIASRYSISALVINARDANFGDPRSWTAQARPDFQNAHTKIFLVRNLGSAEPTAPK